VEDGGDRHCSNTLTLILRLFSLCSFYAYSHTHSAHSTFTLYNDPLFSLSPTLQISVSFCAYLLHTPWALCSLFFHWFEQSTHSLSVSFSIFYGRVSTVVLGTIITVLFFNRSFSIPAQYHSQVR